MTQQFTANEVRDYLFSIEERSSRQWLIAHDAELGMLRQFADLLEAREKAVPVATVEDQLGFPIMEWIGDAGDKYPVGTKLYTHPAPSDAERLAEALRCALTWIDVAPHADSCGDADAYNHTELRSCGCGKDAIVENLTEALAAHSAQAQPPAASVTDEMVMRLKRALPLLCADVQTRMLRAALEAALASQENPNG